MMGLAYLIAGSQPAAERTLRRALAKTARRWHRVGDRPESHIITVMCRYEASWWRRLGRGGGLTEPDPAPDPAKPDPARPAPAETGLAGAMRRALVALPAAERVVIALQHHERLTQAETARVLGRSVSTVRRRTARAEARLRELLADLSTPEHDTAELEVPGRHRHESYV